MPNRRKTICPFGISGDAKQVLKLEIEFHQHFGPAASRSGFLGVDTPQPGPHNPVHNPPGTSYRYIQTLRQLMGIKYKALPCFGYGNELLYGRNTKPAFPGNLQYPGIGRNQFIFYLPIFSDGALDCAGVVNPKNFLTALL